MDRVLPNTLVPFVVCLCLVWTVRGQDIHFSQFYNAPQVMNPALTGIFYGDVRIMGHYKKQWANVPADFLTFSGNYDRKIYPKNAEGNDFFGFGVNFNYDNAGFSKLSLAQLQFGGSYSKELATNTFLTGGIQIGLANRAYKQDDLTSDSQWDPTAGQFDPSLPLGEDFDNTSIFFADFSLGANLRLQKDDRRTKLDFGVGLYHLNKPRQEFFDASDIKLDNRFSIHALGAIKLGGALDLILNGTAQFQGKFREYVPSAALRIYLNQNRGKELAFQVGGNWRLNNITDAIAPAVELHWRTLAVGVSYDINVSDFEIATDNRGGPEIWLSYRIVNVKPLEMFKTCPIF